MEDSAKPSAKVLVVDDEPAIVDAVSYNLRKNGYNVVSAGSVEDAMVIARSQDLDIVLLDVMLPRASGFEMCRRLRKESNVPIILLTAKADESDKVLGLELGADDYVTKPFGMRELLARIAAVLRRREKAPSQGEKLKVGDLVIDKKRHEVLVRGQKVDLSRKEYALVSFLASYPGQVFTRMQLIDRIWPAESYVEERTVDVHVRWLREKLESDPARPQLILTVRGAGYKLEDGR